MRILLIFFNGFQVAPLVSLSDFVNLLILIPVMTGLGFTFPVFIIPLVELKVIKAKAALERSKMGLHTGRVGRGTSKS